MGAVKQHGEIPTNYKVSKTPSNSVTLGLIASITVVNPTTVSTTAAYPTPTTDNSTTATKSMNSDYFMWIANHFAKEQHIRLTVSQVYSCEKCNHVL